MKWTKSAKHHWSTQPLKVISNVWKSWVNLFSSLLNSIKKLTFSANAKDVDINKIDVIHNDWNALHYAILQDNVESVKILIKAGADAKQKDGIGRTPQIIADDHFKTKVSA